MSNFIPLIPESSYELPAKPNAQLAHLPGPSGHWLYGNFRQLGPNPAAGLTELRARYGDCFTLGFFRNRRVLVMVGPAANELILMDRDGNFSSHWGWEVVQRFFGRNILVRDFDDHHQHRKLMTHLFKAQSLKLYLKCMRAPVERSLERLEGPLDVYQRTKTLALDIAVRVFAGITADDVADWNRDLTMVLSNVMAHRIRLPGTSYWQALRARDRLRLRLQKEIANRRGRSGDDLLSQLVNHRDEEGRVLCDQDIVDHMFGFLFAAHDTTASSLAMLAWQLARYPDSQTAARQECRRLREESGTELLRYEDLGQLTSIDSLFKETLRMFAPIQFIPRRNQSRFCFQGHNIPENTQILLAPQVSHFDSELFAEPDRFLPQRFEQTTLTPFSFIPFGKGSHTCLGMQFANMEIKAVLYRLLLKYRLRIQKSQTLELDYLPIVRPKKGMTIIFESLADDG